MAVDLKSFLRSDETVVYESRFQMRDMVWLFCGMALVIAAAWRLATIFFPFLGDAGIDFLIAIIAPVIIVLRMRQSAVLVTDQRILASASKSSSDLIDVPLHEIAAVAYVFPGAGFRTGYVSIKTRSGNSNRLPGSPNPEELCRQLAASAEVSADGILNSKIILLSNLAVLVGFLTGFYVVGTTISWFWDAHGASAVIVYGIPILIIGMIAGYFLGDVPAILLARLVLSPSEAQSLACVNVDPYSIDAGNRLNRICARPYGWVLSLLYGQKIRCD